MFGDYDEIKKLVETGKTLEDVTDEYLDIVRQILDEGLEEESEEEVE